MVFSLNSFVGFTSTAKHQNVPRVCIGASTLKASHFPSSSTSLVFSRRPIHTRNQRSLSVSNSDSVTTETTEKTSEIPEISISINQSLPTSEADPIKKTQPDEAASNGSISSPSESEPKRSKLTAREKLKAARVRSRSSEPKPVKKSRDGKQSVGSFEGKR
ncbi:unnamed protein product [Lactuca virosa]|uniref:Uncharacterized protein n=1 Tax=Lactuca virosa TaxID=75947 RepID=A0AAU9NLT3_9ASTR|nr:unnamed protein product [Lactuca virosa]